MGPPSAKAVETRRAWEARARYAWLYEEALDEEERAYLLVHFKVRCARCI